MTDTRERLWMFLWLAMLVVVSTLLVMGVMPPAAAGEITGHLWDGRANVAMPGVQLVLSLEGRVGDDWPGKWWYESSQHVTASLDDGSFQFSVPDLDPKAYPQGYPGSVTFFIMLYNGLWPYWAGDYAPPPPGFSGQSQLPISPFSPSYEMGTAVFWPIYSHGLSVSVSATNTTVAPGDSIGLSASATDSRNHAIASWRWDDGGAGGSFSSSSAPSTTYIAPPNPGATNKTVSVAVTATCVGTGGRDTASYTANVTLTVLPGHHELSVSVSAPAWVESGGTITLSASASDGRGHGIASWRWDDGGAGGTFLSSASATTLYIAPETATERAIAVTATATCDGQPSGSGSGTATLTVHPTPPHELTVEVSAPPEVHSGGTITLGATAQDNRGHGIANWSWDDGGAHGSFSSQWGRTTDYIAPDADADEPIILTVTAQCSGTPPVTRSASTTVIVRVVAKVTPEEPYDHQTNTRTLVNGTCWKFVADFTSAPSAPANLKWFADPPEGAQFKGTDHGSEWSSGSLVAYVRSNGECEVWVKAGDVSSPQTIKVCAQPLDATGEPVGPQLKSANLRVIPVPRISQGASGLDTFPGAQLGFWGKDATVTPMRLTARTITAAGCTLTCYAMLSHYYHGLDSRIDAWYPLALNNALKGLRFTGDQGLLWYRGGYRTPEGQGAAVYFDQSLNYYYSQWDPDLSVPQSTPLDANCDGQNDEADAAANPAFCGPLLRSEWPGYIASGHRVRNTQGRPFSQTADELETDLKLDPPVPALIQVRTGTGHDHWVLAVGLSEEVNGRRNVMLLDPGFRARPDVSPFPLSPSTTVSVLGHDTTYEAQTVVTLADAAGESSRARFTIIVSCNAQVLVTNALGQRAGVLPDGSFIDEIGGASYDVEDSEGIATGYDPSVFSAGGRKILVLPADLEGNYTVAVIGTGPGPYFLAVTVTDDSSGQHLLDLGCGTIDAGITRTYEVVADPTSGDISGQRVAPVVVLTGQYSDTPDDIDGDGLYERLGMNVGVLSADEGLVTVKASLVAPDGEEIQQVTGTATVAAQTPASVRLEFGGAWIWGHLRNGPYHLRQLQAWHADDPDRPATADDPFATRPYSYTQFARALAAYGTVTDVDGSPVVGAKLTFDEGDSDVTDSNGAYNAVLLTAGTHSLALTPPAGLVRNWEIYLNGRLYCTGLVIQGYVSVGDIGCIDFKAKPPDSTPPTTTASLTGTEGTNGWYRSAVQVALTATDNEGGSGVNSTEYCVDGTTWVGYTDSFAVSAEGMTTVRYRSTDNANNMEAEKTCEVKIDTVSPSIQGATTTSPNGGGWFKGDVVVHFAATDDTSGIDTVTPDTTLATEGPGQPVTGTATDRAGNTATATVSPINIDRTAPQISITTPGDGATCALGAAISAGWSANDSLSGLASASGTVPSGSALDTATVGTHTFSVTAADTAENRSTASRTYYVRYAYSGILEPINADGTSIFKLGSTVPVKFQLRDANGAFVTTAVARIYVAQLSNGIAGTEIEAVSTAAATSGNLFRYTGDQYIFNLGTKSLSRGTWQIRIAIDDGASCTCVISLK